jgi:osmoprotectant transport system permease protein
MELMTEILLRTGEHLVLVFIAMASAIAIGIPLGIFITRQKQFAKPILVIANAIQTIPSLAIFGFLITVPLLGGIGKVPAIVALTLYALLPLILNTYTGLNQVDPGFIEAGLSMGMSRRQVLFYIELPLALNVILTGIRVSTVICVGIATIAAAIGAGGLGTFIFRGISTVNNQLILAGAIPSALIALTADWGIGWLEKKLTRRTPRKPFSRKKRLIWLGLAGFLVFSSIGLFYQQINFNNKSGGEITIGSKNFTEQVILSEILAQQIENNTNLKVDRKFNLGGTFICHEAVKAGKIAGYVEYTGTALTAILKEPIINNSQEVYRLVKQAYQEQFGLTIFPSLGFENTFAIVIRGADAQRLKIKTLSEAARYTNQWQAGFGYEFLAREDGFPGLAKTYGLEFAKAPKEMDLGLMYRALADKQVDLVAGNSTDGLIPILKLVILQDDKHYFPPYDAVPVFNEKILQKYPPLRTAVLKLSGQILAEEMQQLNYQVDNQVKSVEESARSFLQSKGLIKN